VTGLQTHPVDVTRRSRGSGCLALAVLCLMLPACKRSSPNRPPDRDRPPAHASQPAEREVRVATVAARPMEQVVNAIGALAAHEQATLSVKVAGRLDTIAVDLGSVVRQGDLIARVEARDYELRLRQAEALLAQARARLGLPLTGDDDRVDPEKTSTVTQARALFDEAARNRDRVAKLAEQRILSESALEAAEAAYEVAANRYRDALEEIQTRLATVAQRRAEFEIARKQLEDTSIYAPFSGAVQERLASVGDFRAAGTPVVTLVKTDPLRLRLEVPERQAARIQPAQTVRLRVEGDPATYTGQIARLSPAIREQNRMLMVEADVRNDGHLRPGLFVRGEIVTRSEDRGLAIPPAALVAFAGVEKVFVVKDGRALERPISTGRRGAGWIEVTAGVTAGDAVVLEPGNLQTGEAVRVAPARPETQAEASSG